MAQQQVAPPTTPYGVPISFEMANRATAAAEAEAIKNNWGVAIAVVDSGGNLVILHRLDNAQLSSGRIGGVGLRTLTFGACLAEGGLPIIADGKIIGAIGVSGVASHQDAQVAKAGADAVR